MFGFRTPLKATNSEKSPTKGGADAPPNVRRSIGEREAASSSPAPSSAEKTSQAGPAEIKGKTTSSQESKTMTKTRKSVDTTSSPRSKYSSSTVEARSCLIKAKQQINGQKNIKTEVKTGVFEALERLYEIVKEVESELKLARQNMTDERPTVKKPESVVLAPSGNTEASKILEKMELQSNLLVENSKKIEELKDAIDHQRQLLQRDQTYASVTATHGGKSNTTRSTLHSIVVASKDDTETGDEVLDKIRKAADAKEGWVKVERVRKAKDRKIIMGFQTREERNKMKSKLEVEGQDLSVEEVKNKDPLLILRNVLSVNSDEDVLRAMRNQNRDVFHDLDKEEDRMEVKFRRKNRNPHTNHVVVSVSPTIWRRATGIGCLHVDLQRVRVEDQTPLIQCTRCLGYGHGKRFCKESADLCSHCGGPHLKTECADWLAGTPPKCQNCTRSKLDNVDHNAFSIDCPTRRKWDIIARSTVAYC